MNLSSQYLLLLLGDCDAGHGEQTADGASAVRSVRCDGDNNT